MQTSLSFAKYLKMYKKGEKCSLSLVINNVYTLYVKQAKVFKIRACMKIAITYLTI